MGLHGIEEEVQSLALDRMAQVEGHGGGLAFPKHLALFQRRLACSEERQLPLTPVTLCRLENFPSTQ